MASPTARTTSSGVGVGRDPGQVAQRDGPRGDPAQAPRDEDHGQVAPAEDLLREPHAAERRGGEIEADHREVEATARPVVRAEAEREARVLDRRRLADVHVARAPPPWRRSGSRRWRPSRRARAARATAGPVARRILLPRAVPTCDPFPYSLRCVRGPGIQKVAASVADGGGPAHAARYAGSGSPEDTPLRRAHRAFIGNASAFRAADAPHPRGLHAQESP